MARGKSPEEEAAQLQREIEKLQARITRESGIAAKRAQVARLRAELRDLRFAKAKKLATALGRTTTKLMKGGIRAMRAFQDYAAETKWANGKPKTKRKTRAKR